MAKTVRKSQKAELAGREARSSAPAGDFVIADGEPLNLHNRYLAAFLSWLVPGAGHYYQGRALKACIYFASIMACIIIGLVVSGGRCVYASWNLQEKRWQFILQAGVGLQAVPAVVQNWRKGNNNPSLFQGWFFDKNEPGPFAAPDSNAQLDQWHKNTASGFDLGSLYTMIAGLLNFLAIFDAFSGPLPPPTGNRPKAKATGQADGASEDIAKG